MKDMKIVRKKMSELIPSEYNPRAISPTAMEGLKESLKRFGLVEPIVWNKRTGRIVGGHQRHKVMSEQGVEETDVVEVDLGETEEVALNIALNNPAIQGDWDESAAELLQEVGEGLPDLFRAVRLDDLLDALGGSDDGSGDGSGDGTGEGTKEEDGKNDDQDHNSSLFDQFVVPPFTVLDQRKSYWRNHRSAWLKHGVRGEFDPVLASLIYKWFCPVDGVVLDLDGDETSKGLVAGLAGCRYVGVATSEKQAKENKKKWEGVRDKEYLKDFNPELTPIERVGAFFLKRDDLFCVGGVRGGKVRTCWSLSQGAKGLITAGSRMSPQVNIVSHIAGRLGLPCRVHTPEGELSPEVLSAKNTGAEVVQHNAGYNSVIISRAQDDAKERGWTEIPFGMECQAAVDATRKQVANIPKDVKRILMVVGSGMSLSGVLHGLNDFGLKIPVVGISVGADPEERLNTYAPKNWREMVTIIKCPIDYHDDADGNIIGDVIVDPIYEGKCLPYLEAGDLFWIVGVRETAVKPSGQVPVVIGSSAAKQDGDDEEQEEPVKPKSKSKKGKKSDNALEPEWHSKVPEDGADLSLISVPDSVPDEEWDTFYTQLCKKIELASSKLNDGRFSCVLFDDIADKDGFSRGLFHKIVREFEKHDMKLYNEALLVVDEPWFASRCADFQKTRKNHRMHRTFLSFFKGELKAVKSDFEMVDLSGLENTLVSDPGETSECVELE